MKNQIKCIRKHNKLLIRFMLPMLTTALLCMTSPVFAQIPYIFSTVAFSQNKSGASLEQTARALYQEGKYSEAAELFQQAAKAYQVAKDPVHQALSLTNLSLCYKQLGQWNNADSSINQSIKILTSSSQPGQISALAQSYHIQAELQLARGQTEAALKTWQRTESIYKQQNQPKLVLVSQTNQAKALQNLGLHRRAVELIASVFNLSHTAKQEDLKTALQKIPSSPETIVALRTLGDSLRVVGNLPSAKLVLERTLGIAQELKLPEAIALTQLSLGNTARAQLNFDETVNDTDRTEIDTQAALNFYKQAAITISPHIRVQAQLNQLSLLTHSNQTDAANNLLPEVRQEVEALPKSLTAIDARINLAQTMMRMRSNELIQDTANILAVAVKQAQELGNPRTLAYAQGSLGSVYEQTRQFDQAEKLTSQALQIAQQINAGDIAYLWQWQLGRVTKALGKNDTAIAAYKEAIGTIKSLRADLAAASPDVQFSFRNAVEPIHRELVELLVSTSSQNKENLKSARDIIEGLQLVELDNFFREACLTAKPEQVDRVDAKAAVIYPIILKNQLAIITSLPKTGANADSKDNRDFNYYKTKISNQELEQLAARLSQDLRQPTPGLIDIMLPKLQKMYDLVVRPIVEDVTNSKAETLVFVLDGVLRNIPMSALHDGKQFLVEKYSVALTPGLQLLAPRSLRQERLGALVAGLSEARLNFSALPNVVQEVSKIQSELPSQVLLNQNFTNSAFRSRVSRVPFPIVHLATHGQFSSNAEDTFILTWDDKIKVNELSGVLKTVELSRNNSLELLVLSACQTAAGDAKSALGLAGVAVRSGARSTIATLWQVNDEASAMLMSQFYDQLIQAHKTGISKAEALRRAQVTILKNPDYKSPYFWSAYVLLGNWT
ncbi:MAG: CHAT domain-containing protein [Calothrix sp. C42_A2020_038]|nr:CHAT domain-containing protein [Calothrix sp. C42_A2020_038]